METLVSTKKTIIFAFLELLIASHIFHQRMQLWNLTYLMICYIAPTGKPSLETVSYKGQATLKYPFMVIGQITMYYGLTSTNKISTLRDVVVNQMLTEASREKNENILSSRKAILCSSFK